MRSAGCYLEGFLMAAIRYWSVNCRSGHGASAVASAGGAAGGAAGGKGPPSGAPDVLGVTSGLVAAREGSFSNMAWSFHNTALGLAVKCVAIGVMHGVCQTMRNPRKQLQSAKKPKYNGVRGREGSVVRAGRYATLVAICPMKELIMRLALKLGLVFMLANMALAGIYGYMAMRREVVLFQRQVAEEADEMGPVMSRILADAWTSDRDRGMHESLRRLCSSQPQPLRVRWVWFDAVEDDSRPAASSNLLTQVVLQEHGVVETAAADGTAYLVVYWPVALNTSRQGGLEFAHPMTALTANQRDIISRTGLLIGGMAIISGLLAVVLGIRLVGRPLQRLIAKARLIGIGNLEGRIDIRSHDELQELADNLNAMCANLQESQRKLREETAARIAAMEQLRHADRLKTVGRLASGIAHELGTPLNVVAGRAGLIGSGKLDPQQITESAAAIRTEADKMTLIIRQLLDFARSSTPRKQPVDLRSVVRQTIDLLDSIAEKHKVRLQFEPGLETVTAEIDSGQIQQVLTNLTMNAIQAMPQSGSVEFRIGRCNRCHPDNGGTPADFLTIAVHDHGVGIPEQYIPQLFEPFFTTKEVGAGTGLGLSIAYGIVQEHGGWIDVTSQVGQGSCFTVFLPVGAQP